MTAPDLLNSVMKLAGLTQHDLAVMLGYQSDGMVADMRAGRRALNLDTAQRIADGTGLRIRWEAGKGWWVRR